MLLIILMTNFHLKLLNKDMIKVGSILDVDVDDEEQRWLVLLSLLFEYEYSNIEDDEINIKKDF